MTPERWDEELRAAGFTGNESIAYDSKEPLRSAFTMLTRMAPNPALQEELANYNGKEAAMMQSTKVVEIAILINDEPGPWALELAGQLRTAGHVVQFMRWGDSPKQDQCIISLVDLDGPFLYEMDEKRCHKLQVFLQRLDAQRMFWIMPTTTPTQHSTCKIDPRYSLVFGFAAALRLETNRRFINVQVDEFNTIAARVLVQILEKVMDRDLHRPDLDEEYEFAVAQGTTYISRCHWIPITDLLPSQQRASAVYKLDVGVYGLIDTLQWVQAKEQILGKNDVEIEICYVSLNFRVRYTSIAGCCGCHILTDRCRISW